MKNFKPLQTRIVITLLISVLLFSACGNNKPQTQVQLTPEQQFQLAKIGMEFASNSIAIRISSLQENPEVNAQKISGLTLVKGLIEEFNRGVADLTLADLSGREGIRLARDRALAGADNLLATGVIQLKDPATQNEVRSYLAATKTALKALDVLFPSPAPSPQAASSPEGI